MRAGEVSVARRLNGILIGESDILFFSFSFSLFFEKRAVKNMIFFYQAILYLPLSLKIVG